MVVRYHWVEKRQDGDNDYLAKNLQHWALGTTDDSFIELHRNVRNVVAYIMERSTPWIRECLERVVTESRLDKIKLPVSTPSKQKLNGAQ